MLYGEHQFHISIFTYYNIRGSVKIQKKDLVTHELSGVLTYDYVLLEFYSRLTSKCSSKCLSNLMQS